MEKKQQRNSSKLFECRFAGEMERAIALFADDGGMNSFI